MEQLHDLLEYPNRKIYQNKEWFAFSLDSILLANFVTLLPTTKKILDIGTGTAPIPLILSLYTTAKITGIEIQTDVAKLATKSIKINNLEHQIDIINENVINYSNNMPGEQFDIIVCNPPYFKKTDQSVKNENFHKTIARHEIYLDLETVLKITKKLLKNKGVFAIVQRSERFIEVINLFQKYGLEPKKVKFIYSKDNEQSKMFLLEGTKGGKSGLKVEAPLVIYKADDSYTQEYLKFIKGGIRNETAKKL